MSLERFHGRLTGKQTRRFWRCLDKMANNYPVNPMAVDERTRMADENRQAAHHLSSACMDVVEEFGAAEVNAAIEEAERSLGLELAAPANPSDSSGGGADA